MVEFFTGLVTNRCSINNDTPYTLVQQEKGGSNRTYRIKAGEKKPDDGLIVGAYWEFWLEDENHDRVSDKCNVDPGRHDSWKASKCKNIRKPKEASKVKILSVEVKWVWYKSIADVTEFGVSFS